jgi:hypothetical protein
VGENFYTITPGTQLVAEFNMSLQSDTLLAVEVSSDAFSSIGVTGLNLTHCISSILIQSQLDEFVLGDKRPTVAKLYKTQSAKISEIAKEGKAK